MQEFNQIKATSLHGGGREEGSRVAELAPNSQMKLEFNEHGVKVEGLPVERDGIGTCGREREKSTISAICCEGAVVRRWEH